jgi:hypothetical protein
MNGMVRTLQDTGDYADLEFWRIVPNDLATLGNRMYVAQKPIVYDTSCPMSAIYCGDKFPSLNGRCALWLVTIRVQGFLWRHNFAPLGNWNGYVYFVS